MVLQLEVLFIGTFHSLIFFLLSQVQDKLEDIPVLPKATTRESRELAKQLSVRCSKLRSKEARDLVDLLSSPHIQALIDCHDQVARISEHPITSKTESDSKLFPELNGMTGDTIRMVGVRKKTGEPLGLTVSHTFISFPSKTNFSTGRSR